MMSELENSFAAWSELAHQAPERLADVFLNKRDLLPPESQRALIASAPDRDTLLQSIKCSCADADAPLAGVPYFLQDMFDVEGLATRCGAPFQEPFEATLEEGSLLYHQLKKLGAVLLAKSVPSEFGIDPRGRNKIFGDCPNAEGLRYICGGGAGTCAHAVSAGWAPIAFGLDSAAGIRIPAAFHGLFGFRMGNNAYAREGVFPIVPSLESVGWVTAQLEDLQSSIEAFCPTPKIQNPEQLTEPRGYLFETSGITLDPELKTSLMNLCRHLDIDDRPNFNASLNRTFSEANEAYATIESRELYSIHQYWIEEYRARYSDPLLRRIEAGQICTSSKADRAASVQQRLREAMVQFFSTHDYLIMPISALPTPDKASWSGQIENDLLRLNAPTSLSFLPAIILPFTCDEGRHSAVQLILNPKKTFHASKILQQVKRFYN
jgi:Asp-tRNA(Asn)/Glu-tRNA(Gln) amidotransferase A subunit family amidase